MYQTFIFRKSKFILPLGTKLYYNKIVFVF